MKNMTKIIMVATLAVGTLAAGCQTTNLPAPVSQPITAETLQAHHWQLVDAKRRNGDQVTQLFFDPAKPLTLNFMNDNGRDYVAFMNTCNNMGAGYSVVNGEVTIKNAMSTLMACPEPQASFDTATLATVQGKYNLSKNAKKVTILTIKNDDQVAYFKAVSK
ncbi:MULTISPECIES: META domain-containing protein [unclassified Psychrobacter]|uniref:META domain-containing protein n=1 Tax=unclassified Psychrobacter TaxID=196806 RepID=UPI0025B53383|nr:MULTISPECIES: META domain-containing protein [unclassified Psychrobacter]MDN3453237.1 META domain-containing protein [Psychrobacter sp. APC 3350]MDN3502320.1 META domain-containing protein [Psychrobacter sp. 5A.1]